MKKTAFISFIFSVLFVLLSSQSLIADEMMAITGTVNDYYQIVTDDGEIYNIGDNEKGMELDQHTGSRIEAFGAISSEDDELVIMISDYKIIPSES